jgi:Zn finger protein HypA/HybF involved in hydrogenase expression
MERFPRGTLPPPPPTIEQTGPCERRQPRVASDLASTCPTCNTLMQPEHAHYRCPTCGYRDSCCF